MRYRVPPVTTTLTLVRHVWDTTSLAHPTHCNETVQRCFSASSHIDEEWFWALQFKITITKSVRVNRTFLYYSFVEGVMDSETCINLLWMLQNDIDRNFVPNKYVLPAHLASLKLRQKECEIPKITCSITFRFFSVSSVVLSLASCCSRSLSVAFNSAKRSSYSDFVVSNSRVTLKHCSINDDYCI